MPSRHLVAEIDISSINVHAAAVAPGYSTVGVRNWRQAGQRNTPPCAKRALPRAAARPYHGDAAKSMTRLGQPANARCRHPGRSRWLLWASASSLARLVAAEMRRKWRPGGACRGGESGVARSLSAACRRGRALNLEKMSDVHVAGARE